MSENNNNEIDVDINYFKLCLKEYLKLDDEINTLQTVLRNKKQKYENLSVILMTFLDNNNISQVQLEGEYAGKELKSQKSKRTKNVSSKSLMEIIKSKCSDNPELLNSIIAEVESKREINEFSKIKIMKPKIPKRKATHNNINEQTNNLLLGGIPTTNN